MSGSEPNTGSLSRRGMIIGSTIGLGAAAATGIAGQAAATPRRQDPTHGKPGHTTPGGGRRVLPGADRAAADDWSALSGQKLGVITNPTGIVSDRMISIVDAMVESGRVNVSAVFGPEHGFRGTAQAGESEETYVDERTGVTVYDAYGAQADKFAELFTEAGVETIVFDIQDVGVRFYTYIWTMYQAMIAAVRKQLRFVVLDRPVPIGGQADGPLMTDGFTSGVGQDFIVQQQGMTAGELARFYDGEFMPDRAGGRLPQLDVIEVANYRADTLYADTGLPWVLPSPNMPTADTARLYAGTCLFEATNLSEGRGTTRPFELIGAPYVDHQWAAMLNKRNLPGVYFREAYFTPTFSKNEGKVCGGVQVHLLEPAEVQPIRTTAEMLVALRDLYDGFAWRTYPSDAYQGQWLDKLTGSARFRTQLEAGATADDIVDGWSDELSDFNRRRRPYLLYRR
ncbi:exo-beta-N-acetylmuramidase NamZ family protein [Microlunatus soli]|uniref:Uncharacterized conserved protein YbbC, DUF1343 family n=1 Tax=Microlunatus soli TaxID=630515 RepID=A0A1H1WNG1_9ACTN|nr:DUF1343 domain-containing protein [Microlunatus soli]SDS98663.1 Uncharacterized conserved protein YbbC, DUF1343 family [Microlunatus soli]